MPAIMEGDGAISQPLVKYVLMMDLFKQFETIGKNGFEGKLEMIGFVEDLTDGFQLEKLKALKEDLALYIELHGQDIENHFVDLKGEESFVEIVKKAGDLKPEDEGTHEGWSYRFELMANEFRPEDHIISGRAWNFIWLDQYIRKKINEISTDDSIDEHADNEDLEPWNRIDGTASKCIKLFIEDNKFVGNNDEIVKAFLVSFEIRSQEEFGKPHLGKVDPTVVEVIKHDTYPYDEDDITGRTLGKKLKEYWNNYRDPNAIEN